VIAADIEALNASFPGTVNMNDRSIINLAAPGDAGYGVNKRERKSLHM